MKRNERIIRIIAILTDNPNRIYPLSFFSDLFNAAKSTVSEDISICRKTIEDAGEGEIITYAGASGGVKFVPKISDEAVEEFRRQMREKLAEPERKLPGNFTFTSDLMFNPKVAKTAGRIFATRFLDKEADYVVTIEAKGIAMALMTAESLNIPLVVMRREGKIAEGSTVSISYVSGSADKMQKMSVSKRSLRPGTKAIIIDDFMRGGGSAHGMKELLSELDVETVGIGVLIAMKEPEKKRVSEYYSILTLE